jgi:hypothetical protein
MGIYQRNGTVIAVGTSNWAGGLSSDGNLGPVDLITKNILTTLSVVSISVTAASLATDVGTSQSFAATGTLSNGKSRTPPAP